MGTLEDAIGSQRKTGAIQIGARYITFDEDRSNCLPGRVFFLSDLRKGTLR
jgi:hypothetical protein